MPARTMINPKQPAEKMVDLLLSNGARIPDEFQPRTSGQSALD